MQYIALLRGINVGGNNRVAMGQLKDVFLSLGFSDVTTYLNTGNVLFTSVKEPVVSIVAEALQKEFGFAIPILIKSQTAMHKIAASIPKDWKNDTEWKCDIAYLFAEIDTKGILAELPIVKEYADVRYVEGAVYWRVNRKDYNKSHLNKLISHKLYKKMTIRNVNTARYLGGIHSPV